MHPYTESHDQSTQQSTNVSPSPLRQFDPFTLRIDLPLSLIRGVPIATRRVVLLA